LMYFLLLSNVTLQRQTFFLYSVLSLSLFPPLFTAFLSSPFHSSVLPSFQVPLLFFTILYPLPASLPLQPVSYIPFRSLPRNQ
jgi:hypothetical protein